MSYRSATDVDVASRALVMAGTQPINSFQDGTTEADVARLLYEDVAAAALVATTWRFTITQRQLNRLDEKPTGRGIVAFQIPSDCLQVRAVTIDQSPIRFERYGEVIHTFETIAEQTIPVIEYAQRTPTPDWPPYFVPVVQHLLASEFAIAIGQNEQLANIHAQKAEILLRSAKSIDAQGRVNSVMDTKRFIRTRRT